MLPFHRAVVRDPAFTAEDGRFGVHTRWIETEFVNAIEPWTGSLGDQDAPPVPEERQRVTIEVDGKRLEVSLPAALAATGSQPVLPPPPRRRTRVGVTAAATGTAVTSPMQATVIKVAVQPGQRVVAGDLVAVLEAMKMEQPLVAHRAGVIGEVAAKVGATVASGAVLLEILDDAAALAPVA